MGRSVNRTKKANIKCQNCKFMKETMLTNGVSPLCTVNNTLIDLWDKCDKFQWRDDKSYNDTPEVNLLR